MGAKKDELRAAAAMLGSRGGKRRAENLSEVELSEIGSKGGKARAAKLSATERKRIATLAVRAREKKRAQRRKETD